ncbi:hypothetical protein AB0N73_06090 [Microbacterium sp. NPDC089189]|uniref:hypothetical protein n=1 Tax=Microbacterium sp. NPDC089189 TaxID=3154972 RepID=UPI0034295DC7
MTLYDPTLAATPGLVRRRSALRTSIAIVVLAVAIAVIAYTVPNIAELSEQARENAEDASRARYRFLGGFFPIAQIILFGGFGVAAIIALAGNGTRMWVREATGSRLRKRFEGYHALSAEQFEHLHAAFASGDPAAYTPLPDQVKRGNGVVFVWTADADRRGYVGMTWGSAAKTTRNAPLIRLEGEDFDRLDSALRRGLRRAAPVVVAGADEADAVGPVAAEADAVGPVAADAPASSAAEAEAPASSPARIYALASNRLFWQPGDPFVYPYAVDLRWDGQQWRVEMSEGVTFSAVAAIVSVDEALSPRWAAHIEKAEGGWLRPYLQRIASGEQVSGDELAAAFERRHRRPLDG